MKTLLNLTLAASIIVGLSINSVIAINIGALFGRHDINSREFENFSQMPFGQKDLVLFPSYGVLKYQLPCTSERACPRVYSVHVQAVALQYTDEAGNFARFQSFVDIDNDDYGPDSYLPPLEKTLQFNNFKHFFADDLNNRSVRLDLSSNINDRKSVRILNATSSVADNLVVSYNTTAVEAITGQDGFIELDLLVEVNGYYDGSQLTVNGEFEGVSTSAELFLHGQKGLTVVFDVDETLKLYGRGLEAIKSLLFRKYVPVPGVVPQVQKWYNDSIPRSGDNFSMPMFYFLSAGPWPMASANLAFVKNFSIPFGPVAVNKFSVNIDSPAELSKTLSIVNSQQLKTDAFAKLFRRMPNRTYILSGDSVMKDPEFQTGIMQNPEFASQIAMQTIRISPAVGWIKNRQGRFNKVLKDLPESKYLLFRNITEMSLIDTRQILINNGANN
ncbi:hypothetical protein MIR68_005717 [Amoeboaphelidium protococcarum]|nr:hypothetical protein MIR68_005717 [Amoeboaphelidium protococcarum]